jgi:hypothetical protein
MARASSGGMALLGTALMLWAGWTVKLPIAPSPLLGFAEGVCS